MGRLARGPSVQKELAATGSARERGERELFGSRRVANEARRRRRRRRRRSLSYYSSHLGGTWCGRVGRAAAAAGESAGRWSTDRHGTQSCCWHPTGMMRDMFDAFQPWVLATYGDSAKTKTITARKYARILRTLQGHEANSADNSKFRFWVKAKGFRVGPPPGHMPPLQQPRTLCRMTVLAEPELYVPTGTDKVRKTGGGWLYCLLACLLFCLMHA
jgi:hypothetical protein